MKQDLRPVAKIALFGLLGAAVTMAALYAFSLKIKPGAAVSGPAASSGALLESERKAASEESSRLLETDAFACRAMAQTSTVKGPELTVSLNKCMFQAQERARARNAKIMQGR